MPDRFIIGTRGSRLALVQTRQVREALRRARPALRVDLQVIRTQGDRDRTTPLDRIGGHGVFVRGIERALAAGEIDCAVHSLKDMPSESPPGLVVAAIPIREDPSDVWVARGGCPLSEIGTGARVGTGSLRRAAQLRAVRPDLEVIPIRGNVETRLAAVDEGAVEAVVLAAAGIRRLDLAADIGRRLPFPEFLPAPGQGALAVQVRTEDRDAIEVVRPVHDGESAAAVTAERAFLAALGGGCRAPIAALGTVEGNRLHLHGRVLAPDGSRIVEDGLEAGLEEAAGAGRELASRLVGAGAGALLAESRRHSA